MFLLLFEITGFCLKGALGIKSAKYIANKRSMEVTNMKKGAIFLITAILTVCLHLPAQATVISFDDITTGLDRVQIDPNYYSDFTFRSEICTFSDVLYGEMMWENSYGSPSGEYAVFNRRGAQTSIIDFIKPTNFEGAFFTGFAKHDAPRTDGFTAESITLLGYSGDELIGSIPVQLPTTNYLWIQADFSGLTRLVIQSTPTWGYWLMDNFTYDLVLNEGNTTGTTENTAPVPEPTTLLLLGAGLMGIAGIGKKFKKS